MKDNIGLLYNIYNNIQLSDILRRENRYSLCLQIKSIIKAFEYYDSCMNTTAIEARGVQPIRALLSKYDILVDNSWDEMNWNLENVLIGLLEDLGTKALFEVNVELGMRNNSFYFISVSVGIPVVRYVTAILLFSLYFNYFYQMMILMFLLCAL